MTDKQTISSKRIVPHSPLNPYRSIIERDPIEDHFTNKRVQKHMRHLGLVPKPPDTPQKKDPTSLAQDEHKIWNSEKEKEKRYRRKFIVTIGDSVQEIDRARQAEFRNQLELWDKMYSNRIQRLQAYDRRLERKYGLFVDRAMKKELIRENLSRIPQIPSVSISHILPNVAPIRRINRVKLSKSKRAPSAPPIDQNIRGGRSSIDEINVEHNEVNKLKGEIKELKTDLNDIVKDQDMLKLIQLEHEAKISELNKLGNKLETKLTSHVEKFKNIQKKHEDFDNELQTFNTNMKKFEETINAADNGIIEFKGTITKQQQELKQFIKDNINLLQGQITKLEKEFKEITGEEINKIKEETAVLTERVGNLEETIKTLKLPPSMKKALLPYVERLAPVDLFEVDWKKYRQENEGNTNN